MLQKRRNTICGFLLAALPIISYGQQRGIQFEQGLNWRQIQEKAIATDKYIFMDCFASWCGPCKDMDKDVYPNERAGEYFNTHFISVKVQIDTSIHDMEWIKDWYAYAHNIMRKYKIGAFPTFLFFSPDGRIVNKSIGFKGVEDLLALGVDALNPRKQYYTQLEKYEQGGKDYTIMAYLARTANSLGETDMAQTIAKDYADHYLFRLEDKDLYFKENIEFVREFTESSKDLGFLMFYQHGDKVDKVMEDSSYSQGFVDYIIAKEEIDQVLWPVKAVPPAVPDWRKIKSTITQKYGKSYADRTITGAKVRWYGWKRDWPEFTKSKVILVNRYGTNMSNFDLDVHSWDMFLHSREKNELNDAINWIKRVLQKEPDWPNAIDTYANLLYKTDRKQEALIWEEKAARLAPEDKGIQENFMKMKKSEPTWETN